MEVNEQIKSNENIKVKLNVGINRHFHKRRRITIT
jgi:hypothetical protein